MNQVTRIESHPWSRGIVGCAAAALLLAALGLSPQWADGTAPTVSPPAAAPPALSVSDAADQLAEIMVEAREPRYVAPTGAIRSGAFGRQSSSTGAGHSGWFSIPARATPA